MPLYEYICANGHRTEVMHGIYAAGPEACPVCGASVRKAFVAPTFVFKGSGWAKVDRRASGAKKAPADDASGGDNASDGRTGSAADDTKTPAAPSAGASKSSEPLSGGTSSTTKASVTD